MKDLEEQLKKKEKLEKQRKKKKLKEQSEEKYEDLPSSLYHKLYG